MSNFMKLVMEMRQAQKFYFRNRSYEALKNAKTLEKQVDEYLNKVQEEDDLFDLLEEQFDGDDIIGFRD